MRNDGAILRQILNERDLYIQDVADALGITRQAITNYFNTKKFSFRTMQKVLKYLYLTEEQFLKYNELDVNNLEHYETNDNSNQSFCLDQLKTVNQMLQKALENESRALSLLDHLIKKNN
jgi:transcriptional regulator with XRE-family HTH domain